MAKKPGSFKQWMSNQEKKKQARAEEKAYQDEVLKHHEEKKKKLDAEEEQARRINALLEESVSLEDQILEKKNSIDEKVAKEAQLHEEVLGVMQSQLKSGDISEKQFQTQTKMLEKIAQGEMSINELKQMQKDLGKEGTKEFTKFLDGQLHIAESTELATKEFEAWDSVFGGLLGKAKDFGETLLNPIDLAVLAFTAFWKISKKILEDFSAELDAIGEKFGVLGVQELSADLMAADVELRKMGHDAGAAAEIATELTDTFGVGLRDAIGMAGAIGDMSKAIGISTATGSKLVGMFTTMSGMSAQQAEDTAKMAYQLAASEGVNPGAVLEEIASSTETFAKFSKDGGKNLIEASVVAKKLGTNLDQVASTMESMLNFSDSTTKAMEASIMLGRDINVQKLQELSLAGDATGVLEEQKRLLGDANKWDQMNVLEKKKLAEALGLSVEEANKMVMAEEEAASLSGELAKQKGFDELVGEEALSNMTDMLNSIKSIGAAFVKIFGPALNAVITPLAFVVGIFGELIELIDSTVGVMPLLIGLITAWGVANAKAGYKAAVSMGKSLLSAVAKIWEAMSAGSLATLGFGTPGMLALGAGAVATILASMMMARSKTKKVGDLKMEQGAPVAMSQTPGGLDIFQGNPADDLLMGPGIASAGGGGESGAVVAAINKLNVTTQQNKPASPKTQAKENSKALANLGE